MPTISGTAGRAAAALLLAATFVMVAAAPALATNNGTWIMTAGAEGSEALLYYTAQGTYNLESCDVSPDGHHTQGDLDKAFELDPIALASVTEYNGNGTCNWQRNIELNVGQVVYLETYTMEGNTVEHQGSSVNYTATF